MRKASLPLKKVSPASCFASLWLWTHFSFLFLCSCWKTLKKRKIEMEEQENRKSQRMRDCKQKSVNWRDIGNGILWCGKFLRKFWPHCCPGFNVIIQKWKEPIPTTARKAASLLLRKFLLCSESCASNNISIAACVSALAGDRAQAVAATALTSQSRFTFCFYCYVPVYFFKRLCRRCCIFRYFRLINLYKLRSN